MSLFNQNAQFAQEAMNRAADNGATLIMTLAVQPATGKIDVYSLNGISEDKICQYLGAIHKQMVERLSGQRIITG